MNSIRHILHVHIAEFEIALARLSSPDLRGRPVAVAPIHAARSLIISASREARMEGVFKGMSIHRAKAVCPGLTLIEPDPETAEKAFRAVGHVASFYTPLREPAGLGHIYLDMTGTERLWGRARDAAFRIGREIGIKTGLFANVGVACNKTVSNIASRIRSNEAVMDVEYGTEADFLAPLRASTLPGIGFARSRLLENELDIKCIGQIAALDPLSLTCLFGRDARVIHQRARGIDPTPVTPPVMSPMVREEISFEQDTNDIRILSRCLHKLVETCSRHMRDRAIRPGSASVRIRYSDRVEASRRCRLPRHGFSSLDLYPPIEIIFQKAFTRRVRIRYMELVFRGLRPENGQLCLFNDQESNGNKTAAINAIDRIRHRYGEEAIRFGRSIPGNEAL